MKLQLTKTAKQEFKVLNIKLNNNMDYHKCNRRERLLQDAMLYIEDAYVSNNFKNLDNWCLKTGKGEFINDHKMRVKKNISKMIMEDIINIINN